MHTNAHVLEDARARAQTNQKKIEEEMPCASWSKDPILAFKSMMAPFNMINTSYNVDSPKILCFSILFALDGKNSNSFGKIEFSKFLRPQLEIQG